MDDALILRQQAEIETLRERIAQLEAALVPDDVALPIEWGLTSSEARLFAFLTTRDVAAKAAIMHALYGDRIDDEPEMKIVDVFVCKLRRKLKPFAVDIRTIWGQGYALTRRGQWRGSA